MASRIAGITIEIGGDTSNLQKSLKGVDSQLKKTQSQLKDVDKLLKLNPGNTELLTQKQKLLNESISLTKERLAELKNVSKDSVTPEQWDALQREIIDTEGKLQGLQKELRNFGSVAAQQIKAAGQQMKEFGGKVEDAGKKFSGISGAAAGIGGALLKMGYDAVTGADELNTLAKQTGFTTEEIQKMQYAADLIDVSFEDISGALKKFKTKIDPTNASLASLGVSTINADGSLRNATDVFNDAVVALSGISNETERDQVAMELFGKSADSLAGIIDDGGAALQAFGQQAEDLGLILDQDTLDSLNETNDTLDELKANLAGTMGQIGADVGTVLAPVLEKGAELIGKITEKLRELTPEQTETILKIAGVVAAIAPVLIIGGKLISGIGSLVSVIGTVVGVLGGPLTLAIAAAIAIGVLLWKNWDKIKEVAIKVKDGVVSAWNTLKEKVSSVIDSIRGKIDALKEKFEDIKAKAAEVVQKIKDFFNFRIELPKIKLPHLQITYSPASSSIAKFFGINNIPHLSIQWYKKAYDNPVMFTSPTVMATPNGYKGFGDGSGAEIVMGLDKLRQLVGAQANGVTINIVQQPWQDAKAVAREVQRVLVAEQKQRELAHA